jgi:biotin transport system substrate-specific component
MRKNVVEIVSANLLFAFGGQFEVPIGPVPFILADFFVFFAALRLRPIDFAISVLLFLALGGLGAPVFAGGAGGFSHLMGPTSGYLFGYLFGGLLVSHFQTKLNNAILKLLNVFFGYYLLFVLGITGLVFTTDLSLQDALKTGFTPFILSMHLKAAVAWGLNLVLPQHN